MGLFKSMKDMAGVTKQAKQLQREQQQKAGHEPGMGGTIRQMGDMMSQAKEQLAEQMPSAPKRGEVRPVDG